MADGCKGDGVVSGVGKMMQEELERLAAKSEPLPNNLTLPEQWLYLSLRVLYREFKTGAITREQATKEKTSILKQFEMAQLHHKAYTQATERSNKYGYLFAEAEKSGCDVCRKIVRILDGRMSL